MKHVIRTGFICILMIFIFTNCKAQRIKYDDLLYALNHSFGDIEHRLLTKGISFSRVNKTEDGIIKYRYSESDNSSEFLDFSVHAYDDKIFESSFSTSNQKEYLLLRTDIIKLGFTYNRNVTTDNYTFNHYAKGDYEVSFSVASTEYDEKVFSVNLINKNLKKDVFLEIIALE